MNSTGIPRSLGALEWLGIALAVAVAASYIAGVSGLFPLPVFTFDHRPIAGPIRAGSHATELGSGIATAVIEFASVLGQLFGAGYDTFAVQLIFLLLAGIGVAAAALAALIFLRARNEASTRQLAWLLTAYALFGAIAYFFQPFHFVACCSASTALSATSHFVEGAVFIFVAVGTARFLVLFPRPVDSESIHRTFFSRLYASGLLTDRQEADADPTGLPKWIWSRGTRSLILQSWHKHLVNGRLLWASPLAGGALNAISAASWNWQPSLKILGAIWNGSLFVTVVGGLAFYILLGLPYAFASTTHVFRFGSDAERRRVAFLRAGLIGLGVITFLVVFMLILWVFVSPNVPRTSAALRTETAIGLPLALYILLLPSITIIVLTLAVLYRGALDPRVAFSRITVWSLLGLFMTIVFIAVERLVALRLAHSFDLPADSGAVFAGALVAATFVPVRNGVSRTFTGLAARWLPLETVARGERVTRCVAFVDLSGYTSLAANDEPGALLQSAFLKRQAEKVAGKYQGRLVKGLGDAVLLTFHDATTAVPGILELHANFARGAEEVAIRPLPLHSGLHEGELVETHDGDIFGQSVNLAARLVHAAAPGEIVCSETVHSAIPGGFAFEHMGQRRFKNVPEMVDCYRIVGGS